MYGPVKEKAVEGAKTAAAPVREHPYQAIGIALGGGAVVGYGVKPGHRVALIDFQ